MGTTAAQDEFNELMRDKSRLTSHPTDSVADNSDAASFLNDNSSDDDSSSTSHRTPRHKAVGDTTTIPPQQQGRYTVPTQRHQSNTGPKGVITDAQAYRDAARTHARAGEGISQQERERNIAQTQPYISSGPGQNGDGRQQQRRGEDEDEDELDEDDGGFMDQWRQNRLRQLQGQQGRSVGAGTAGKGGRRLHFGGLVPVDGPGYLEVVEGSGDVTVVVVFIYDDQSEVSLMVEECIQELARKWMNTRFIKLHYQDAEMEPMGVPAVLAYRGGDKFAGLVPVVDEIPDDADLTPETLERLFQNHQIL